jgi:ribose transport system ATP-binding protein
MPVWEGTSKLPVGIEAQSNSGGAPPTALFAASCPILEMKNVSKRFPGVVALRDVALRVLKGEIHGLVGENGAGKSTLIKILSGAHHADEGEIEIDGQSISRPTPLQMLDRGIAVIYQETMLAPHLSVAENLWLGRLPTRFGLIDWREVHRRSADVLARLGFVLDPTARVSELSVAQRQMVEIAGALSRNARIVVLDEPSAVLGGRELEKLFEIIRRLSKDGVSFIYISHRLQEVFAICDRVTVLRDGQVVGTKATAELDSQTLISMMVGRRLADIYPQRNRRAGEILLAVEKLNRKGILSDIDIDVKQGEILGICGLAGSGRSELLRALVGADPSECRSYHLRGKLFRMTGPRAANRNGLCLLPEDRKSEGCFLPQTVAFNVTISGLERVRKYALLNQRQEESVVGALVRRLDIKTPSSDSRIDQLSGGNQQKCMIARSLNARSSILLVDEPTRGVDVGAKREIYKLLARLADDEGAAIIMVSSELPEILGLSDRIIVMRDGCMAGQFAREEATEEILMAAALGMNAAEIAA